MNILQIKFKSFITQMQRKIRVNIKYYTVVQKKKKYFYNNSHDSLFF